MRVTAQLVLECARCNGEGVIPCAHDTVGDCSCPLWECPECEGTGQPIDGGESMPDDIGRPPGDAGTSSQGARVLAAVDPLAALSWLLEQWLSDVDPDWATHVLDGLRAEDPAIFEVLDAVNAEDQGEGLLP